MTFKQPVSAYMSTDVTTVTTDAMLTRVGRLLEGPRFSAVPVVTPEGKFAGVITRTELLHAGRVVPAQRAGAFELVLPEMRVSAYLSTTSPVCSSTTTLQQAARLMVSNRYHRLIVVDDDRVVGIISTQRLVAAVRDARLAMPLCEVAHGPVATLAASESLAAATAALERSHEDVVLIHEDWPVGVFTAVDGLASRWLPGDTPAIDVCDRTIIALPATLPLFHAASMAAELDVTRVIAMRDGRVAGVAGGLDLARVVAA